MIFLNEQEQMCTLIRRQMSLGLIYDMRNQFLPMGCGLVWTVKKRFGQIMSKFWGPFFKFSLAINLFNWEQGFVPCDGSGPGSGPLAFVSPHGLMFYRSSDFSNMAQSAAIITYLFLIGAVFSIVMEFVFSATWAWFDGLVFLSATGCSC